jgi:propanol-preferring alcohol dehydrogenase
MTTPAIPKTQRAAVVAVFGEPTEIRDDHPVPQPDTLTPGQVLIKMDVSGICHSDLHIRKGEWPTRPPPFVGGHEGVGHILMLAKGTPASDEVKVGSRVGVKWALGSCGRCEYCRTGKDPGK